MIESPPSTPPDRRAPLLQMVGKALPELHPFGVPRSIDSRAQLADRQDPSGSLDGADNSGGRGEDDEFEYGYGLSFEAKKLWKSASRSILAKRALEATSSGVPSATDKVKEKSHARTEGCCASWCAMVGLG
eukprot:COSAG02_NODE_26297_length_636_cov_0.757914_1_plen_130_part_10